MLSIGANKIVEMHRGDLEFQWGYVGDKLVFKKASNGRLPAGYTELEYISNPNLGYIWKNSLNWLPVAPFQGNRVELTIKLPQIKTSGSIFGNTGAHFTSQTSRQSIGYNLIKYDAQTNEVVLYTVTTTASNIPTYKIPAKDGVMSIIVDVPKGLFEINETSVAIPTGTGISVATWPSLFASSYKRTGTGATVNYGSSPMDYYFCSLKLYASTASGTGDLIHDYVPCISPDGVVGIYNIITNTFYESYVTGKPFVAGPAV